MKKRNKSHETPQMRAERLQLSKCMQPKVMKNKKRYNRKRDSQKVIPFQLVYFL